MHTRADKEDRHLGSGFLDGACNDGEDRADPDQHKRWLIVLDDPVDIFKGREELSVREFCDAWHYH